MSTKAGRVLRQSTRAERIAKLPRVKKVTNDSVNHPSHYTFGKIEVIDAIEDWRLDFHEANAVKYIARAKHKGRELEDLEKSRWYIDRKIKKLKKEKGKK